MPVDYTFDLEAQLWLDLQATYCHLRRFSSQALSLHPLRSLRMR